MYTLRQKAALCWGKLRRSLLVALRKNTVVHSLERRRGECLRCGSCCKILFRCPYYDDSNGRPLCTIYDDRPGVCGLFPIDERDVQDRDIVNPFVRCGYRFEAGGNKNGHGGNGATNGRLRWGPPKIHSNVRYKYIKGIVRFLLAGLRGSNGHSRRTQHFC